MKLLKKKNGQNIWIFRTFPVGHVPRLLQALQRQENLATLPKWRAPKFEAGHNFENVGCWLQLINSPFTFPISQVCKRVCVTLGNHRLGHNSEILVAGQVTFGEKKIAEISIPN